MTTRKKIGLRAALAKKTIRATSFDIPLEPSDKVDAIAHRLTMARQRAMLARDEAMRAEAEKAIGEIAAELDACFWRLEFRGLPGDDDLDALMNAHPPKPEDVEKAKAQSADAPSFDFDGASVALLVACCTNGDEMTEDDWREELWSDKWTPADRHDLFGKVWSANQVSFSAGIPKG